MSNNSDSFDPKFIGAFLIRNEMTILPAEDPTRLKLEWTIYEQMGFEVLRFPEGHNLTPEQIYHDRYWPRDEKGEPLYHKPITVKEDLKIGDKLLIKEIWDYIWMPAIYTSEGVAISGENGDGGLSANLKFGEDDRNCWVCSCLININGIVELPLRQA